MTSVEKRRSGRKSGGHRKHSDGGRSDTSSGGSYLDETDREVSNLTDRAFRSLCIGDEAVYNDSDLCSSSPCAQRDRQLAFSHSGQDRYREDREELKRAAHESFSLRMQQYGQDWIHGGMYGAEIQRDPQWDVYGERTEGRVSATFQHSCVETSQQQESLREEQLSFLSNGATELSSQQRRSRSRVSSLIRAFNSEGQREGAGMDGKLREWNDETSWDKSALMSIQRELSEFSTSYQQNFNNSHFPSAGPFSSQDSNFYSSEVAAVAQMNSASSFMRSSHNKHSMSTQVNCNSNFFIHSEFSPFKVWRDHNRFPFQQGQVSGFMHCSEFPKWYETPMYRELSLEAQPQDPYGFQERGFRYPRNNLAPVVPPNLSRSTSTVLQKASAVEKRCESELTGHYYPHRKRTQSLGANRLQSQRPSTASPTREISRRVQDTISSVKALQQKIKMMTEQNMATANQQGVLYSTDNLIPYSNNTKAVTPDVFSSNTRTTPFSISQPHTPLVQAETPEIWQYSVSPQPVEHAPVRAESRGATPDVRMSSYKSRATSLLFNLKDNRKRVKSTYSPTKFKGLETVEKNKQSSAQQPRDTVIDIPDYPDPDFLQVEESSRTNAATHPYINQYHSPGLPLTTQNSLPVHTGQYTSSDYQTAQMQSGMVHHSGLTGFIPEDYTSNQLANGQTLHEDIFTPYKQGMIDNVEALGGDAYRLNPFCTATETPHLNADNNQPREYLISMANAEQHLNETVGREFAKVERYQQLKDNKHDYSNVSSQDRWRQTNSQDTETLSLKAAVSPWKQEITALMEKDQHAQAYQRAVAIKEELNLPRDKYRGENQQSLNKEVENIELRESFGVGTSPYNTAGVVSVSSQQPQYAPFSNETIENPAYYAQQQPGDFKDNYVIQNYYGHNKENEMKNNYLTPNYNRYTDQQYRNQQTLYSNKDKSMFTQETGQRKQYTPIPKMYEMQSQPIEAKPQFEHNMQRHSLSNPESATALTMANQVQDKDFVEVKAEQFMAEHKTAQHAQAELATAQHWAQVEQPKAETARLILAGQAGSEKVKAEPSKAELTEHERVNQAKAEHIKEGKRQEEQSSEQTKTEQTEVQKVTEEPRNITEQVGAEHLREVQGEQVKAKQAEAERLKEEHIKTELAKAEQAGQERLEQAKTEHARRERIKAEETEEERLRAEQVEREQMEAEQIRTEKVKAEQAEAELKKEEQAKLQQKEQQTKTEQEKVKVVEANKTQEEDVKQEKVEEDLIQAVRVNAEQPTTEVRKADERKAQQAKLEQTKLDLAKAELTKKESMLERSAKPAAKLTMTQQVKSEPDKVEQVKTELAKAKAELAKIKEKMRGEQKARNTVLKKEDVIKRDVPLKVNKNEEHKVKDQEIQKQREDSVVVSRQSTDQVYRDEFERLREKYGLIDITSTKRNKVEDAGNVPSNDANDPPTLALDKAETTINEKSKDKSSPTIIFATDNAGNKEEVGSFKSTEMTESQYVYSESSKEFKLSGSNDLPTNVDKRANSDTVTDNVKDDSEEKLKHTNVLQQRGSNLAKPLQIERKPKPTEHSVGKDQHFTPSKTLSHKERAQTKQEILTSKIKAHAEKEISAIKEKGFAVRDGFMSKNSTKQLSSSNSIRQKPPSQEVSKKQESTMSSNITPKQPMEPSGMLMEPVKSVTPPSNSATIPVKTAATTSQLAEHSQKQVPREPMKSDNNVSKPPREQKQMESYTMTTDEDLVEKQKKENQSGKKSPIQSKDQAPKNKQGKLEENQGENSVKQKNGHKDNSVIKIDQLNKKKEYPSVLVESESSKCMTTEAEEETVHEAPSLNLVFCPNQTPVDDDSLQITGIMVTVRERKPSVNYGESDYKENSEFDQCHHNSGLEVSKEKASSKKDSIVKPKDRAVQNSHPTVKEDQTSAGMNNHPDNMRETPTLETRQNNVTKNATVKRTDLQESSSTNARPQRVTQLQEPLAEKGVPPTVTVPAKNKVLAETQPLLVKQDIIVNETKDYTNETAKEIPAKSLKKDDVKSKKEEKNELKSPTVHTNESSTTNTAINYTNDSKRTDIETLIRHDIQPPVLVKEDVINPSKNRNIDVSTPLVEENSYDLPPPSPFNDTDPSQPFTENENTCVPPKHQYEEIEMGENDQASDNVHIGSIAIKVVPAVTEKDLKVTGKNHVTIDPSDVVAANEHTQVASSGSKDKVTSNNGDRTKDLTPVSNEEQIKLGVQSVFSSVRELSDSLKINNQQNSISSTSKDTQAENGKPDKENKSRKLVDESKIRPMVEDYFQVQGLAETNIEPHNHTNVKDTLDAVSKGRELPGLLPNKAAVSNESRTVGNNEVFVLDESIRKTAELHSVGVQIENMKRKNKETEDNLASKQSDGPTERHSHKNEKTKAGQAIHTRKHLTENQSSSSARERQRNSHPTRENTAKENPDVKPKPKERVSAIPEISALADYARLKVIVSEDEASPIQEFPPNKKEGFFPIFQTRHSRRPVFTADPQDFSVKEKSLPTKTEVNSKVNKEPKPLVFPITEKEHQRTGMFKLGDKERQEKIALDAKANDGSSDTGAKHAQQLKERNKSPTIHLKNQGSVEQGADGQRVRQAEQRIHQPTNRQATTSSSTDNRPRSTSVSQHLKPLDNSNPHEKLVGQVNNKKESTATKTEERRTEKTRKERLASQHEETEAKQQRRAKQLMEQRAARIKEEKRAEDMRVKLMIEEKRAALAEEERRAVQREEERRAKEREAIATKIKERREKQREAERRAEGERAAQKEEEMRAKQKEEERRIKETEEKRRIKIEEERQAKLREEEEQKRDYEERRRQREQERDAQEEKQRRAAQEEEKRRAVLEEQKMRAEQEEQKRRAAQEEEKRRAAQEEQQQRAAQEERQRRAIQEEKQRRAAQEELQRRAAQEEEQMRAAQEEQKRRAEQEEQQRRAAQAEKQRRAAQEKQQMRAAEDEQLKRASQEEKQKRAAQEERQLRTAQEEEPRRSAQEKQQMRAAQEEQQKRAALMEEQRVAKQIEEKNKRKQREEDKDVHISEEERIKLTQEQKIEEQRGERQKRHEWMRTHREEEKRRAAEKEKTITENREEKRAEDVRTRLLEDRQAALTEEEKRVAQEQMLAQREDEIRAKNREEEEKLAAHREKERATHLEEQKRAAQKADALQYYAITSTESEKKPRERQLSSPSPSQQRNNPSGLEDSGSHSRPYRPHAPPSPAPSLPRSNTSSPALGVKPSMFRVKDNTIRSSSFTKSVKPRFHKNFGEDFRVGSPMDRGSEKGDEEQEIMRRSAGTPVYPDTGLNRLAAIKESSNFQSAYSSQDYSTPYTQHRPYSRRSLALDEDDSRSIISNMSEDVESFATSAADLADVRGLYDYDRPESACSFSSDVSRSLGKPPTVPPKSEKALRRAQRLTTRRIKKELSKTAAESAARAEQSPQEVSSIPPSSIEVRSSSRQAVASPHFSSPVSLAHAPTLGSGLPPSHTEHQSSHSTFYASPHTTGPVSLPVASPHATAPVSLPFASPNATGPASHTTAAPKTVAHVPSSPTFHHANHPAPVTQYHVESSYPQSYPLTQRKVLQDLGSGQYFVVDVPVQVKTKTFFDPETGKYVQLNVRESGQSTSRPQPQQPYPQPQLQPQMQVKPQQQPQTTPAGKPFVLYQGGYPQDYQPLPINSAPRHRSSVPTTLHQDQQPVSESHIYGYPAPEMGQNTEGHRYSPEKTPYMDTVNDKDKAYNTVYNRHGPHESFPECDTNSQLAGRSVCENDNSAHSQCQPRDIITIGELEDFMEVSDW